MTGTAALIGLGALSAGSTIIGQIQQASATDAASKATAKSLEIQAGQERAAAQMRAKEERRQAEKVTSDIQAAAAASGAGASDIGVTALSEKVAGEGEYRSLLQMYQGEQAARNLESQASVKRFEAKSAKKQLPFQIGSTIIGAGTSYLTNKALLKAYGGA